MHKSDDFEPFHLFSKARSSWIIFFLCMLFGGIGGLIFNRIRLPVYECSAAFSVTIDYTLTGFLSDIQEDQAMRGLGSIIDATHTLENTFQILEDEGITFTFEDFNKKISLNREDFRWLLRVRDNNPTPCAEIANTWASVAENELTEASLHAIKAAHLERYLESLESCLLRMADVDQNQVPCTFPYFQDLIKEINSTGEALNHERIMSKGIFPAISFYLSQNASVPTSPSLYGRNSMIFAGMVLGLVVGLLLFSIFWSR